MSYDWEKIYRDTSSQELYRIYKGHTTKTGDAIRFAKKELDGRGFDFNDMEKNIKNWQLINALEDEKLEELSRMEMSNSYVSFRGGILLLIGTVALVYCINWFEDKPIDSFIDGLPFVLVLTGANVVINNLIYKHYKNKREKRQQKIAELKHALKLQNNEQDNNMVRKDLNVADNEVSSVKTFFFTYSVIITIIFVAVTIYKYLP